MKDVEQTATHPTLTLTLVWTPYTLYAATQSQLLFAIEPSIRGMAYQVTFLLLLLLKKIGNARPGEGDCHPISPETPAPHYQPKEEKKRKGK